MGCDCAGSQQPVRDARKASAAPRVVRIGVGNEVAGYQNGQPIYRQVSYMSDGSSQPVNEPPE